jgi:ABC-type lipoprotein export system ATPase subunit
MTYDTGVTALRGIDLTIDQGEFAAIMGPSGCSKSTLLNLIAGLEHPTSGEIWIGGWFSFRAALPSWQSLRRSFPHELLRRAHWLPRSVTNKNEQYFRVC